ncbi:type 1 fimbrial protein [Serratia marcescens]|uniref:Type 1 fimbrial protein n=1 Tax=Serratia marcescens TaxID=615 RepID=A0A939NJJ7_SERMA|nr:type 1 fimbrial protein [Serratia marcescens]
MQGAINDAACAIATESREQVFDLDVTSFSDIYPGGQGKEIPFSIHLVNCISALGSNSISEWRQFQITFDGNVDGQMFAWGEGVGCGTGYQRCGWQYRQAGNTSAAK